MRRVLSHHVTAVDVENQTRHVRAADWDRVSGLFDLPYPARLQAFAAHRRRGFHDRTEEPDRSDVGCPLVSSETRSSFPCHVQCARQSGMANTTAARFESIGAQSATLIIIFAAICFGLAPWFAKSLTNGGIASVAIAFYRFLTSALVLLLFLNVSRERRRSTLWAMTSGLAIGLGWIGYVEALKGAPVSIVGVVYMTYPFFTLLIAWCWLGQSLTVRSVGAGLLVLAAASMALSPSLSAPSELRTLLLAFSAPLSFGFAICVLTGKLTGLTPLERAAGVSLGAALGLLPLIVSLDARAVVPVQLADWGLVLGISVVTALLPNVLFAVAAPLVGPARTAMAGSMELPTMFVVGWLVFDEQIGVVRILAGILVIAAVLMTPALKPDRRQ